MAINRGALLAQTYQLPAPQQSPVQAPAPYTDDIGDPATGLQQIDGVTSEYFQKWAALKGFARDVQENLGIDVRFPDPSIPESDRLHRIYLKAMGDLKAQGERLKTGQQMLMADRARGAIVTGDPRSQFYDELNVGTDIVDAKLDHIVEEANNKLEQLYFGGAIKEAEAYYERTKAMLQNRINTDPKNAGYWQRQLDSLIEPTQAEKIFDPNRGGYSNLHKGRIRAAEGYLRKMTNLQKGTAESYKLSDTVFGPNKERVWVSEDTKENKWGGNDVIRYEFTPSLQKTEMVVRDPKTGATKRVDVTDMDPMTHAKGYVSDNAKYAAHGEWLDIAADEMGYLNPQTGEVNFGALLAPDAKGRFETMSKTEKELKEQETKVKASALRQKLESMKPSELGPWHQLKDDRYGFELKGGKKAIVRAKAAADDTGIKFEIENWKEIFPAQANDPKMIKQMKSMSLEELEAWLLSKDAHLLFNQPSGTKSVSKSKDPLADTLPSIDPAKVIKSKIEELPD